MCLERHITPDRILLQKMKLAALYSGGKDSTYSIFIMEQSGHEVPFLVSVMPSDADSMMFHTPNIEIVGEIALSMRKKLIAARAEKGEELTVLFRLIEHAKKQGAEGIVTGAIQSDYQFTRIDMLCHEAGIRCFSPLWRKSQSLLLRDIIEAGIKAVIVATAAEGLGVKHLGRVIDGSFADEIESLNRKTGVNQCGEGGEYETITLDSPLHREELTIADYTTATTGLSSVMRIRKLEKRKKL